MLQAAGRHQCSYLINLQKQEFLLQGGDHTWLKGLSRIPQKLRDLYDINKILAHRPWLLNKSHIEVHRVVIHRIESWKLQFRTTLLAAMNFELFENSNNR